VGDAEGQDLGEQYPGLATQRSGRGIEGDDPIQGAGVDEGRPVIEIHIAVAAAVAEGEEGFRLVRRQGQGVLPAVLETHALPRPRVAAPGVVRVRTYGVSPQTAAQTIRAMRANSQWLRRFSMANRTGSSCIRPLLVSSQTKLIQYRNKGQSSQMTSGWRYWVPTVSPLM